MTGTPPHRLARAARRGHVRERRDHQPCACPLGQPHAGMDERAVRQAGHVHEIHPAAHRSRPPPSGTAPRVSIAACCTSRSRRRAAGARPCASISGAARSAREIAAPSRARSSPARRASGAPAGAWNADTSRASVVHTLTSWPRAGQGFAQLPEEGLDAAAGGRVARAHMDDARHQAPEPSRRRADNGRRLRGQRPPGQRRRGAGRSRSPRAARAPH